MLDTPILVIAGGLFHYFEENKVIALLRMIGQFGNKEVVFDTVNRKGMAMMQKKYMRQVGHADAQMFFMSMQWKNWRQRSGVMQR